MKTTVIAEAIENRHVEECGQPPAIEPDEYAYVSYYENRLGEQLVFVYDATEERACQFCGDAGWDRPMVFEKEDIRSFDRSKRASHVKEIASSGIDQDEFIKTAASVFGFDDDEIQQLTETSISERSEENGIPENEELLWTKSCLIALSETL